MYSTCDLPLATYLRCEGIALAQGYNPQTKEWYFEDDAKCKKLSLALANRQADANVLDYEMHRKQLLSMTKRY